MRLRDREVVELLRDEPELLAIADAVAETQRRPRPVLTRRRTRAFAVVAAAAAVAVGVLLWPGRGGDNGVLDRALAAIGDARVLHVVVRAPTGETLVDLETGRRVRPTILMESWSDEKARRFHLVIRQDGRVLDEVLYPDDASSRGAVVGGQDAAYAALWTGYRDALAKGEAKIEREGRIDGHAVYWIRFASERTGEPWTEVAVDRRTYRPIVFREHFSATRTVDLHVLVVATIPFDRKDFNRLTPRPTTSSGSTSSGGGSVAPRTHAKVKPLLRSPASIVGLKLTSVTATTAFSEKRTVHGVLLTYGRQVAGPTDRSLTIQELRRPDDPSTWRRIPRGFVRIQTGFWSGSRGVERPLWTGYLVKGGVYVAIETGVSMKAVIEAAKALRPPA